MKFFVDTADVTDIRALAGSGLLDGVTTNPSLIAAFRDRAVRPSRRRARRILQAGIRAGTVRADVDIHAAVDMLVGALYAAFLAGDDRSLDPEAVVDTLLAGLAPVGIS